MEQLKFLTAFWPNQLAQNTTLAYRGVAAWRRSGVALVMSGHVLYVVVSFLLTTHHNLFVNLPLSLR